MPLKELPTMEYKAVSNTNAADPGNGFMRFNTTSQGDATQLYFDQLSAGNIDQASVFAAISPGDSLDFQGKTDSSIVSSFIVNAITDNSGWYTLDVEPGLSSGMPVPSSTVMVITVVSNASVLDVQYEYHAEDVSTSLSAEDAQNVFNQLGAEGWQLITILTHLNDPATVRAWFIREA